MNNTNIVTVALSRQVRKSETRPIYSTDMGMILRVVGQGLPERFSVDFANTTEGDGALMATMTAEGVEIPEQLIQQGKDIHAYIVLSAGEDDSETVYDITIPVIRRAMVEGTPSPVQRKAIDDLISQCKHFASLARAHSDSAYAAMNRYPKIEIGKWFIYNPDTGYWQDSGVYAMGPKGDKGDDGTIGNLSVAAEALPAGSAPTAVYEGNLLTLGIPAGAKGDKGDAGIGQKGDKGDKGDRGDRGEPGRDGTIQNLSVAAEALPAGSAPTATYENNLLTLGIPAGGGGIAELPGYLKYDQEWTEVIYEGEGLEFEADEDGWIRWTGNAARETEHPDVMSTPYSYTDAEISVEVNNGEYATGDRLGWLQLDNDYNVRLEGNDLIVVLHGARDSEPWSLESIKIKGGIKPYNVKIELVHHGGETIDMKHVPYLYGGQSEYSGRNGIALPLALNTIVDEMKTALINIHHNDYDPVDIAFTHFADLPNKSMS